MENYNTVRRVTDGAKVCATIKANAYGHGLDEVAMMLMGADVRPEYWGIAALSEAKRIRELDPDGKVLSYVHFSEDDLVQALRLGVELFLGDAIYLERVERLAKKLQVVARVHMMIETGMGRMGFLQDTSAPAMTTIQQMYNRILHSPHMDIVGICSHFSDSSSDETVGAQLAIFDEALNTIQPSPNVIRHIANSGAIMWNPQRTTYDMVRPGIMLYGASPNPERDLPSSVTLAQAMKLVGEVSSVQRYSVGQGISYNSNYICQKDTNIAVINMGYGDGLMRSLGNRGLVQIEGTRYPIAGNVCMDMCMVDLGDDVVETGSEAVFFGDEYVSIDEQAKRADTISYVLSTQITGRPKREYW